MSEADINTHVILVVGFVKKGNKILLAKRSSSDPQAGGQWSIPGGKVDVEIGDGVVEKTLSREILEETGVVVNGRFKYLGSDAFIRVSGHHVVSLVFLCNYKSGKARPLEDQEEVHWFTLSELKKIQLPGHLIKRVRLLQSSI